MQINKLPSLKGLVDQAELEDAHKPMFSRLDKDIPAAIVVFLVALPLCLGIALASGAPLISGLISGVIGGLIIGLISKSGTSVSGPAASVSAVVLVAIRDLGSFEIFLLALVIAGLIQVALGVLKAGLIADYMPTSIIKGLLAAIGIILILAQLPYAFGLDFELERFFEFGEDYFSQMGPMLQQFANSFTPGALVLTIISMSILIFWEKSPLKNFKLLPPALVVVILGVVLNLFFEYVIPGLYVEEEHRVHIPNVTSLSSFVTLPEFSAILNFKVWTTALTLAVIASLSSLLNVEATDNIDPHKRRTPPNRELIAQGIGNTIAGLIGGIAITSVIVRSTVNISAGAETKFSAILHGALLLVSVLFLSTIMNLIPLATLASILLVVGYKLASIDVFKSIFKKGWNQFLPFVVTIVAIIFTDVLIGVLIGSALSVFFLLRGHYYNPFFVKNKRIVHGEVIKLELANEVSFLNKASIKNTLWRIPDGSKVLIDASKSRYIDQDVMEILHDFKTTFAKEHQIEVTITGLKETYDRGDELEFVGDLNGDEKLKSPPAEILEFLKSGNKDYLEADLLSMHLKTIEVQEAVASDPLAVVLTGTDLREPLHIFFNTRIGNILQLRSPGLEINSGVCQAVESSCRDQGASLVVLLGHTANSLIKKALKGWRENKETPLSALLKPAIDSSEFSESDLRDGNLDEMADRIARYNLGFTRSQLLKGSNYLSDKVINGEVIVVSAFFHRKSGEIEFLEDLHESEED